MSNGRSFLTGLTKSIKNGVETRQEQGSKLSNTIMEIILKGKLQRKLREETPVPEGAEVTGYTYKEGEYIPKYGVPKEPKINYKERLDESLKKAIAGEISFEDVQTEFPREATTIDEIRLKTTPIEKEPAFRWGKGLEARRLSTVAKKTPNAQYFINQIETEADLEEFLGDASKHLNKTISATGKKFTQNDIATILEYFGRSFDAD